MKEFILWCNNNQGFLMALLTFVYVLATILIWLSNKKSADSSKQQVKEMKKQLDAQIEIAKKQEEYTKQNLKLSLYEKRYNIDYKIRSYIIEISLKLDDLEENIFNDQIILNLDEYKIYLNFFFQSKYLFEEDIINHLQKINDGLYKLLETYLNKSSKFSNLKDINKLKKNKSFIEFKEQINKMKSELVKLINADNYTQELKKYLDIKQIGM